MTLTTLLSLDSQLKTTEEQLRIAVTAMKDIIRSGHCDGCESMEPNECLGGAKEALARIHSLPLK